MNNNLPIVTINYAVNNLRKKKIIAYPTESVFGIGCDPDCKIAVKNLLRIKNRSIKKGLILVAANYAQLKPYIDDTMLTKLQYNTVFTSWPGPTTFIFPAKKSTPNWLTGCFNSLAVRITNNLSIIKLCHAFGKPLVSTSANLAGNHPCRTIQEVYTQFSKHILILEGETGTQKNPSEIRDVLTGKYFRYG